MIDVQEVTISTATIEVMSPTINKKQVTLAVFRQLRQEPLNYIDGNGDLCMAGTVWGTVNYWWDECKGIADQLHIVWQKGDQLRRETVPFEWHGGEELQEALKAARDCALWALVRHNVNK